MVRHGRDLRGLTTLTNNATTLAFGGAPPDAFPFTSYKRMLQARFAYWTNSTDLLSRFRFFVGSRKEDVSVHAPARGTVLPGQLLHTGITSSNRVEFWGKTNSTLQHNRMHIASPLVQKEGASFVLRAVTV
jgi:hypothetical protein